MIFTSKRDEKAADDSTCSQSPSMQELIAENQKLQRDAMTKRHKERPKFLITPHDNGHYLLEMRRVLAGPSDYPYFTIGIFPQREDAEARIKHILQEPRSYDDKGAPVDGD